MPLSIFSWGRDLTAQWSDRNKGKFPCTYHSLASLLRRQDVGHHGGGDADVALADSADDTSDDEDCEVV